MTPTTTRVIDGLTVALTVATAGFAAAAAVKPRILSDDPDSRGQTYYARMYAARALPLAVAVVIAWRGNRRPRGLLWVAAAAQAADSVIGVAHGRSQQGWAPAIGAALYALSATR